MKVKTIGSKVVISVVIIAAVSLVIAAFVLFYLNNQTKLEVYENIKNELINNANDKLNAKKQIGLTNAISIANDAQIKSSLHTDDRRGAILSLKDVSKKMKNDTNFKNIKVHVHTLNNKSFVRN
jgi:methyl-accepting chemotaxis protein